MQIIYGTPDQVIEKLRTVLSQTQPGIFGMWSVDGRMPHADAKRCVELIGAEVLPALRDLSDELGLNSPEEAGVPVSLATTPAEELHPQPRVRDEAASYDPALHT